MSTNRSMTASYGIALLMFACDGGDGPMRAMDTTESEVAPARAEDEVDDSAEAEDQHEDPVATATPVDTVEPDAIGLPCAVRAVLAARCQGCHGVDAKNGTPLLNRDGLVALSKKDPSMMVIERALLRATASDKPMPPVGKGEPLSEAELEVLRDWLAHGTQADRCDSL